MGNVDFICGAAGKITIHNELANTGRGDDKAFIRGQICRSTN